VSYAAGTGDGSRLMEVTEIVKESGAGDRPALKTPGYAYDAP